MPRLLAAGACSVLSACAYLPGWLVPAAPPPADAEPHLVALSTDECRSVLSDDAPVSSLQQAAARSLDYVRGLPLMRMRLFDRGLSAAELESALTAVIDETSSAGWPATICDRLRLYRVELPQGVLVTGYYQPELPARRTRSERFRYPLYRIPDDLVDVDLTPWCAACSGRVVQGRVKDGKMIPYYSRADIEAGALAGRGDEIAWLDDPVEAFFLHVQGSALLRFDDGVQMQISYASSNGRPYTSLGRVLVEQGKLSRDVVSLQTLKDYLRAHPGEQQRLMAENQRYIFFRPVISGPIGSIGVPLTAGRSIAADAAVYPRGALAFLRVGHRDAPTATDEKPELSRLTLIQDAGTAISGPGRLDVFFGTGATAEVIAGDLRNPGELYFLLPQ